MDTQVIMLDDIVENVYPGDFNTQKSAYAELGPHFFDALAAEVGKRVDQCGGKVPVISGEYQSREQLCLFDVIPQLILSKASLV